MTADLSAITTILGVFIANLAIVVPLFFWNRTESRNDIRHMQEMLNSNRELIREIHNEIHAEMKDFHARLCVIEERRK